MATNTTVSLDSNQMFWLGLVARNDIAERYAHRNEWRHACGGSPARPEYADEARATIRALIAAVRTLDKAKHRAWHREALHRHAA